MKNMHYQCTIVDFDNSTKQTDRTAQPESAALNKNTMAQNTSAEN